MTEPAVTEKPAEAVPVATKDEKPKRPHPIVADGCEVYFNNMKFTAGDEMRNLPDAVRNELLASKKLV